MNLDHDSDDLDYEDNLPFIHVREGLNDISPGESPIGLRTRKCLPEKSIVLCEKQGEILYLEDYERVSGEVNEKCQDPLIRRPYFLVIGKNIKCQNLLKKRHV